MSWFRRKRPAAVTAPPVVRAGSMLYRAGMDPYVLDDVTDETVFRVVLVDRYWPRPDDTPALIASFEIGEVHGSSHYTRGGKRLTNVVVTTSIDGVKTLDAADIEWGDYATFACTGAVVFKDNMPIVFADATRGRFVQESVSGGTFSIWWSPAGIMNTLPKNKTVRAP